QQVPARYAIWGAQWDRVRAWSPLRAFIKRRSAVMDDLAKAIGGSAISLGFLRRKNRDELAQRSFEIPACGGLLLGERTAAHQELYREGIEAEFFDANDPEELVEKVQKLLRNPSLRQSIRLAGMRAIHMKAATYRDRLSRLISVYAESQ